MYKFCLCCFHFSVVVTSCGVGCFLGGFFFLNLCSKNELEEPQAHSDCSTSKKEQQKEIVLNDHLVSLQKSCCQKLRPSLVRLKLDGFLL